MLCNVVLVPRTQQSGASLIAQSIKNLPTVQETRVLSLGREDLLEKEMATHSTGCRSPPQPMLEGLHDTPFSMKKERILPGKEESGS